MEIRVNCIISFTFYVHLSQIKPVFKRSNLVLLNLETYNFITQYRIYFHCKLYKLCCQRFTSYYGKSFLFRLFKGLIHFSNVLLYHQMKFFDYLAKYFNTSSPAQRRSNFEFFYFRFFFYLLINRYYILYCMTN